MSRKKIGLLNELSNTSSYDFIASSNLVSLLRKNDIDMEWAAQELPSPLEVFLGS
jgi:hypothetical protein